MEPTSFIAFILIGILVGKILDVLNLHILKYILVFIICKSEPIYIFGVIIITMINADIVENENQARINEIELTRFNRYKERYC